jgi:hypothetical protein
LGQKLGFDMCIWHLGLFILKLESSV